MVASRSLDAPFCRLRVVEPLTVVPNVARANERETARQPRSVSDAREPAPRGKRETQEAAERQETICGVGAALCAWLVASSALRCDVPFPFTSISC